MQSMADPTFRIQHRQMEDNCPSARLKRYLTRVCNFQSAVLEINQETLYQIRTGSKSDEAATANSKNGAFELRLSRPA